MTLLTSQSRTLRRQTGSTYRGRPLVVELHPGYLTLREKGKRSTVDVPYDAIHALGWRLAARAQAEARKRSLPVPGRRKGGTRS